jgi:hypothetical protein
MKLHSVPSCVINRPISRISLLDLLYIFQVEGDLILTTASTLYNTSTIPLWQLQSSSAGAYMHINDDGVIGLYAATSDVVTAATAQPLRLPLTTANSNTSNVTVGRSGAMVAGRMLASTLESNSGFINTTNTITLYSPKRTYYLSAFIEGYLALGLTGGSSFNWSTYNYDNTYGAITLYMSVSMRTFIYCVAI